MTFEAQRVSPGHAVALNAPVTAPGTWTLRRTNHKPGIPEDTATVHVRIPWRQRGRWP